VLITDAEEATVYAQLTYFNPPPSPEFAAARDRAGRERIQPAVELDPELRDELVALFVLDAADGGQTVVSVMRSEAGLARARDVIMSTELLPDEDPQLLPGPDRIEVCQVKLGRIYQAVQV